MDNETPASTEQESESTKANVKRKEKKSKAAKSKAKSKDTIAASQEPEKAREPETAPSSQEPEQEGPPLPTPYDMFKEILWLRQVVGDHCRQIAELQSRLDKKRVMTHSGKVQIRDKETGTVYPSKNNTYQSMLKAGELKELVDKGIFGPKPEKNNFGWFALVRALPDRFEEVKVEDNVS